MLATWPAVKQFSSHFLAENGPAFGEAAPGDHLQTGWGLWLFGHQLEHGRAPWRDPYSFQPELAPRVNFQGLIFGLPYWPLFALFGAVVAWNLFTLLAYVGAGGAACAWLRALGLPRRAALAGGLAFALAPYRVAQSTGHLLGPISLFLPLALLFVERRRPLLAAAAITAIPLSGQVSLAVGAVPFFVAYALVRGRGFRDAVPGTVGAVVAAELVQHFVISGSTHEEGRSLSEVGRYSADWVGFVSRHGNGETLVFVGWLTPLLAVIGLFVLVRSRRYALASLLTAAVVVPVVVALGTHLPTYRLARHVVPHLKVARVPERLLPIACLALAALLAFAVGSWPRGRSGIAATAVLLVLVAADLHIRIYHAAAADEGNTAYAALRSAPPGRLLELPVFLPDDQRGSAYLDYDMAARRQRPGGYSTTVPRTADTTARRLRKLNCGGWSPDVERLGIRVITQHGGYYETGGCLLRAAQTLRRHRFRLIASDGDTVAWARTG